jgi:hypothetical protein
MSHASGQQPGKKDKQSKKRMAAKNKPTKANKANKKLKSSKAQKQFKLSADKAVPDPLIMKTVAFDLGDGGKGKELVAFFGGLAKIRGYYQAILGRNYLFGTIIRSANLRTITTAYFVQWENVELSETAIDLQLLLPAIELAKRCRKLQRRNFQAPAVSRTNPLPKSLLSLLTAVEPGEEGTPPSSEDEESEGEEGCEGEGGDAAPFIGARADRLMGDPTNWMDEDAMDNAMDTATDDDANSPQVGFRWVADQRLAPPAGVSNRGATKLKPENKGFFNSPLSSFLAFVPVRIFQACTVYSNAYAHSVMSESDNNLISGARWGHDITLKEMMTFFGVLLKMVLRPTPGQDYTRSWHDANWHPCTKHMALRRFQQIRAVVHFNDIEKADDCKDALQKIRPLLNTLKHTFPLYLDIGDEVSLDEASQASRSKYGGDVIFFNPTKPGGKFHFRYYLLCDCTTNACIRIRMATRNTSDVADGYTESPAAVDGEKQAGRKTSGLDDENSDKDEDDDDVWAEAEDGEPLNKIEALVLDMLKPLFDSGRVVNMDNYYTSPKVCADLLKHGVYMRGTCRSSRIGFPAGVKFTKTEAKNLGRGQIKCMVDIHHGIAAMGWTDGNPVHFLTTADGVKVAEVKRRVGRDRLSIRAPNGVKKYNKGMQAVDRNDQLRQLFSLSSRHGFKKYYVKMALGLIDMAMVQAWCHYKLAATEEPSTQHGRYDFTDDLAEKLLTTDWSSYIATDEGHKNDKIFQDLLGVRLPAGVQCDDADSTNNAPSPARSFAGDSICHPVSVSSMLKNDYRLRRGLGCQVCVFEGRGTGFVGHVVICMGHRVRCCTTIRDAISVSNTGNKITDFSWRAPITMTCWEKMHAFYIPRGLFHSLVHPLVEDDLEDRKKLKFQCMLIGSDIYKQRNAALGLGNKRRGRPKTKRKAPPPQKEPEHDIVNSDIDSDSDSDNSTVDEMTEL